METHIFEKRFGDYFEALIEKKGSAWCMDVREERQKMARLAAGAVMPLIDEAGRMPAAHEMSIRCTCGKYAILTRQSSKKNAAYVGRCACEKLWGLCELPDISPFDFPRHRSG